MNKNVYLWRGDNTPPTNYHIWIKSDNSINICNNDNWETVMYPELSKDLKDYVNEQIQILKDGADIDFDTLKEINDWIKEHEQDYVTVIPEITSRIETLETSLDNKVNKEQGKGLSTNDYTTDEKDKLSGIEAGAKVNVQSDWNVTDSKSDQFIKNKPTIPSETTIQNWGFTKNTGTYNKPNTGIPKSDLELSIQNSLNKADSALQEVPSDYVTTQNLQDSIINKVDRTDNAPELTAGFAGNLVGRGEATSEEIGFRPSGGLTSVNDGAARIERLKGNTLVWNQRIQWSAMNTSAFGLKFSSPRVGAAQISGTYTGSLTAIDVKLTRTNVHIPIGHKFIVSSNSDKVKLRVQGSMVYDGIYDAANGYVFDPVIQLSGLVTGQEVNITFSPTLLDLTQMFGAGNEPTTIEEFNARKPLGIDEYAYNEGELISTTADEIKSVGFNAWDEEWEVGTIYPGTGIDQESTSTIRSKNYNRMLPNTKYCLYSKSGKSMAVILYDEDKKFIDYWTNDNLRGITTTSDTRFFRVMTYAGYGPTYNHDICIHLVHTGYRNGEYEPYEEFRRSLPISEIKDSEGNALFPNGLLSAGSVYDEITDTKAIKRIGMVDMGTLNWHITGKETVLINNIGVAKSVTENKSLLCSAYVTHRPAELYGTDKSGIAGPQYGYWNTICVYNSSYTDDATFKAAMSGVMLYYELAEPIEIDLPEPLNLDYEVSDFGTEEVISDTPTTPLKADIIYQFNAVDRIRENSANIKKIEEKLDDISVDLLTQITYSSLKALRDSGSLVKGMWYRITDYVTTTVQSQTKSAGHPFDVIVLATSENELSHLARAIAHEGDTYFDGNDLGAWELWYDLDNDTTKYEWADATNGKGVIYRMIDEKRNDCPYDFKNVLFYNDKLPTNTTEDRYYYTFSYVVKGLLYDGTVEKQVTNCYGNSIGVYIKSRKRSLNRNVWGNKDFLNSCYSNTFGDNCYSNTFGDSCYSNTFGDSCYFNTFGYNCSFNTFGDNCRSNTFGDSCYFNTFGYNCSFNTFGDSCYSNTFGYNCSFNTFVDNCYSNTFGDNCYSNTFREGISYRKIDSSNTSITSADEYYDDGSGQLVPMKHPDLSTQPSILPYKFMGQYVYEQLIPVAITTDNINEGYITIPRIEADIILSANLYFKVIFVDDVPSTSRYSTIACTVDRNELLSGTYDFIRFSSNGIYLSGGEIPSAYLRIVYTTMPEDSSYGYENY